MLEPTSEVLSVLLRGRAGNSNRGQLDQRESTPTQTIESRESMFHMKQHRALRTVWSHASRFPVPKVPDPTPRPVHSSGRSAHSARIDWAKPRAALGSRRLPTGPRCRACLDRTSVTVILSDRRDGPPNGGRP